MVVNVSSETLPILPLRPDLRSSRQILRVLCEALEKSSKNSLVRLVCTVSLPPFPKYTFCCALDPKVTRSVRLGL